MIERREPTRRDLRTFGLLLIVFFGGVGAFFYWRSGEPTPAVVALWSVGGFLSLLYWGVPKLRRTIYRTWMAITFPIGWTVSHIAIGAFYYLVVTPIGLLVRLVGHDPMTRKLDRAAESYWIARPATQDTTRYFRQF